MNIKKTLLLIGVCTVAVSPMALVVVSGCANNKPNTVAYKAYTGTTLTVQTLMGFWDAYLESSYITAKSDPTQVAKLQGQERTVQGLYQKWQASMALAADAGAVWSAATQGTNQTVIASSLAAFSQAVGNGSATYTDLQNAIGSFTNKPLPTQ